MPEILITAYIVGIVVAMPVGPVTIAAGRRAISFGFAPAFYFNMGSMTSDTLYVIAVYAGLAPLLSENDWLKLLMWTIGGGWLCWLGVEAMRTRIVLDEFDGEVTRESRWRSYGSGVGITLFNPLTVASWLAVAGNFFTRHDLSDQGETGILAMVFILIGVMTWALGLSLVLSMIRRFVSPQALHWLSMIAGAVLILFGISAWVSALNMLTH